MDLLQRAYADGGYAGRLVTWAKDKTHIVLEIVRRNATAKGFEVLPRRWIVERTFAWIMKNRRREQPTVGVGQDMTLAPPLATPSSFA